MDAGGGQPRQVVEKITFGAPADNFSPQIEWGRGADWLRLRLIPNPGPATVTPQDDAAVAVNVWQVPRLKGTMIERSDGSPAGFDDLTPGTQVEIVGFRRLPPEPPNTISAVSITVGDLEESKSSLIPYRSEELGLALAFLSRTIQSGE